MTTIYREYILPLPFTPERYRIAQLYTVALFSQQAATGDTSIKINKNDDILDDKYGKCRYTEKIFYLNSKVPGVIRALVPKKALIVEETAYNSFPLCHTFYKNMAFSEETFIGRIVSDHKQISHFEDLNIPFEYKNSNKNKQRTNIFSKLGVEDEEYAKSQFKVMDVCENIQNSNYDPNGMFIGGIEMRSGWFKQYSTQAESEVQPDGTNNVTNTDGNISQGMNFMTCQKFVTLKFDITFLGWLVHEIEKQVDKVFLAAHQQMLCTYEQWKDLTMGDIREMEKEAMEKLNMKEAKEIE